MQDSRRGRVVKWVGRHILPYEPAVRAWLRRSRVSADDIDDLIQEAYCKLAALDDVEHVEEPGKYFFQIVRNLLGAQLRRARVVQIETVAEMDSLALDVDERSPERVLSASNELARVRELIEALPDRCRRILTMRKLEDVPQREIARRLGITESVVENDGVKGMRLLMKALREEEDGWQDRVTAAYERAAKRK